MAKPCFECGQPAEVNHHVVPKSRGGTKTIPLCGRCHAQAHHRDRNMSPSKLIRDAVARMKSENLFTGGHPPYGFETIEGKVVESQTEQEVITFILGLMAMGKTYRTTADILNAARIPCKKGQWWAATVRKVFLNFYSRMNEGT